MKPELVYVVYVDNQVEALYYSEENAKEAVADFYDSDYIDVEYRKYYINDFNE